MMDAGVSFQLEETHALPCLVFEPALDNSAFYEATEVKSKGSFKKIKAFLICFYYASIVRITSDLSLSYKPNEKSHLDSIQVPVRHIWGQALHDLPWNRGWNKWSQESLLLPLLMDQRSG